ncbi:hypothetical protein FQR65_LT09960 [Abscondita terminalis]|nr:hypothetical protein FQR65_LT09960 [Abscondita terminalis]
MMFAILFVCLFSVAYQQGLKDINPGLLEKIEGVTDDCISESKVKEDEVVNMLDKGELGESQELKCYIKCIHTKMGVLNGAGEIQENGLKSQIPPNFDQGKAAALVEKCKGVQADDPCMTAFNVAKCIMEGLH